MDPQPVPSPVKTQDFEQIGAMGGKEREIVSSVPAESGIAAISKEPELSTEVAAAGVTNIGSPEVTIPQPVAKLGVQPIGQQVPVEQAKGSITLPLTDAETAQALTIKDPTNSLYDLALWCQRQLLKIWRKTHA